MVHLFVEVAGFGFCLNPLGYRKWGRAAGARMGVLKRGGGGHAWPIRLFWVLVFEQVSP